MLKIFNLFFLVAIIQGCAFTNSTVKLNYKPSDHIGSLKNSKTLEVVKLSDQRGLGENVLGNKYSTYGETSATFSLDQEVAQFVTDALKQTFQKAKMNLSENKDTELRLTGDILKYDSSVKMGLVSGEMHSQIQLSLKLTDLRSKNILWSEIVTGSGKEKEILADNEKNRILALERAITDVMEKLVTSKSFRTAVSN